MISAQQLADAFRRNAGIVRNQTEGLDHSDSLIQPAGGGNCMNWVVGHLLTYRFRTLEVMGQAAPGVDRLARYRRESEPVTGDGEGVLRLDELLRLLDDSEAILAEALVSANSDFWAQELQVGQRTTTIGQRVFFNYFHECYHVGQLELLRNAAGRHEKVI